jgi:hypothetical protein
MNTMKKKWFYLLLAFLTVSLASCTEDDNFDEYEAYEGSWIGTDSSMACTFTNGYCDPFDNSYIETIVYNHCSKSWQFDENTQIEYSINPENGTLHLYLYNADSKGVYNEDQITVDYYFEDYDHLVIDGYEFERYDQYNRYGY